MDFWKPFHITYSTKARKYIGNIHNETFQPHGKGYFILKGKKVAIGSWNNGVLEKGKIFSRNRVINWNYNKLLKSKLFK